MTLRLTLPILLLIVCLIGSLLGGLSSSARRVAADEPASQGRPITPAGTLVPDLTTRQAAVGGLPVDLVRTPDRRGPGGEGRYLISVNSGYGLQFNSTANRGQQSLAVIDLNLKPAAVIQNVYFPSPQSVNVGVVFAPRPEPDGSYLLYVSGGFENKIWIFRFHPGNQLPIAPVSPGPNTTVEAPFIDVSGFAFAANSPMNQLDATATPINIFRSEPDLRPYKAILPNVTLDNLITPPPRDAATAYWMRRTEEQDLARADMADPEILNRIIWFSVRGSLPMPPIARLPVFDAMRLGLQEEEEEIADSRRKDPDD